MASVTQRIPNYLGGVSKQSDDKKKPGQVKECINAYPEPTFGLIKRPGFKFIHSLDQTTGGTDFSGTALDNAKWFYINRDDDETYIGCILSGAIHIWNAVSKVKSTVTMQGSSASYLNTTRDNYSIVTVQDTTIVSSRIVGDTDQYKILGQKEMNARANAIEYECNQGDYTYFGHPRGENNYISYQPYKALYR